MADKKSTVRVGAQVNTPDNRKFADKVMSGFSNIKSQFLGDAKAARDN
jgi:hypothetical protein